MLNILLLSLLARAEDNTEAEIPAGTEEMHRALSARDGSPPCEDIEALSPEPVQAMLYITEHAQQPPWAGVRAAECLITRHAEDVQPQLEHWVQHTETRGFALLVFNHIDDIPTPVATTIVRTSLTGPLADDARSRLEDSNTPEITSILSE